MGIIKVRYLIKRAYKGVDRYYWAPKAHYMLDGRQIKCPYSLTRLKGSKAEIHKEAERLNGMLDLWLAGGQAARQFNRGTVGWLIIEYRKDPRYTELRATTQKLYLGMLPAIRDVLGDIPADKVSRQAARAFCLGFSEHARKPSAMAALCRLLFNFGKALDLVTVNPFDQLRISKPRPRRTIWPAEKIDQVQAKAIELGYPSIALAVQLGVDTAQRPGDLRALTWAAYDGKLLRVRQSKTGVLLDIPVLHMKKLKAMLDAVERKSPVILIYEGTGRPYSKELLANKFREICEAAGVTDEFEFRDFRRTFMVHGAEGGLTGAELSSISGHQIETSQKILEVYIPRTGKMATNAAKKMGRKSNKK